MANGDTEQVPSESSQRATGDLTPVVGIGASAGGLKALIAFFEAIPADVGAAFVVIVHLDPSVKSELPGILAARSRLPTEQLTTSTELRPNRIYVIPPDRQLQITDHEVSVRPFVEPRGRRAPIDLFFRSLAEQHGDSFAVILSGAGSDGAAGAKAIKEHGGIVLVQSPDEAEYPTMPRSAIATEAADFVLPVRQLAERVVEVLDVRRRTALAAYQGDEEDQLRRILAYLRVRTGHDFSLYKRTTVLRRIVRRMQVARTDSLDGYLRYLRANAEEPRALLTDLLISVTQFFRDAQAFESLRKNAIEPLFKRDPPRQSLRTWVVGCATGEEAYSVAMLLLEEAGKHEIHPEIQVFASDLDTRALTIAREGRYPVAIEADLSEERLDRYFARDGEYYRAKRELRDLVLFANHSVLRDPPFSRLSLISCRNLLIYLDHELQSQVLTTLNYALEPDGYLMLGASESADQPQGLFRAVDREARIFQSGGRAPDQLPPVPRLTGYAPERETGLASTPAAIIGARAAQTAHRQALEVLAPPSILVDAALHAVHLSETAGRFLMPSGGPLTADVTDLVRPELRFELRSALHRAFDRDETKLTGAIPVTFNGKPVRVYMHVKPLEQTDGGRKRALVLFVEGEPIEPTTAAGEDESGVRAAQELKQELELAQSRLRTMREESEAATEELRAANEELQSINEEYRSTAEELETSKEELQSINEELQTVNSELKLKLESVSRANSDLQNLMAATDFATLFLDPALRIRRFTPKLAELFNITPGDIGRLITDFTHDLDYDLLPADAARVLKDLTPLEREIHSRKGGWYLVRYRPYRTVDDKIDGIVLTFVDVTQRKGMEEELRASEQQLRQEMRLVDQSKSPIFVWDFDSGEISQWNKGCETLYGYSKAEAVGKSIEKLLKTAAPRSSFAAVKETLSKKKIWKGELRYTAKNKKIVRLDTTLELIAVDGNRHVFESGRPIEG